MAMHGDVQWQFWCAADHPAVVTNWVTVQTCMRGKPSSCTTLRQYGSCGKGSIMAQLQLCSVCPTLVQLCSVCPTLVQLCSVCPTLVQLCSVCPTLVQQCSVCQRRAHDTWHQQCHTV